MRVRALIYPLHSWLGIISGVFLLVISLSGVSLLFRSEIDDLCNREVARVPVGAKRLSYDRLLEAFQRYRLPGRLEALSLPEGPDQPVRFEIENQGDYELAWLDPYSGRLLLHGRETATFAGWLNELHYRLLAGDAGEFWAGLIALILVLTSATGLYVQGRLLVALLRWPRRRTRLRDSHNLIGTWALLASILFGLTGAWMCRFALFRIASPKHTTVLSQGILSADRYLRQAVGVPGFEPHLIVYPTGPRDPVEVLGASRLSRHNWMYGQNAYRLTFDAESGELLSRFDPTTVPLGQSTDQLIFTIHSGGYMARMPLWLKLLYAVFGLAPAVLVCTGYWLYFRRLARNRRLRQTRPLEVTA